VGILEIPMDCGLQGIVTGYSLLVTRFSSMKSASHPDQSETSNQQQATSNE